MNGFIPPSGLHDAACEFLCKSVPGCTVEHSCSVCDVKKTQHFIREGLMSQAKELLDEAMSALAQGHINIVEGVNVIEADSRVHKAMGYLVKLYVEGGLGFVTPDVLACGCNLKATNGHHTRTCKVRLARKDG